MQRRLQIAPEAEQAVVGHFQNAAHIGGFVAVEKLLGFGTVGIQRFDAIAIALQETECHQCVEEIPDAAGVQAKITTQFLATQVGAGQTGEHTQVDGGEQNFRTPEAKAGGENAGRIQSAGVRLGNGNGLCANGFGARGFGDGGNAGHGGFSLRAKSKKCRIETATLRTLVWEHGGIKLESLN